MFCQEGTGVEDVLEAVAALIPPPTGLADKPLEALIFDAHYDPFRGTIVSCRIFNGSVRRGDMIRLMYNNTTYKVEEVGIFRLDREPKDRLSAGDVGYIIAGIKTVSDTRIGDTITLESDPAPEPLPGFKDVKPVVFSSIYPVSSDDYPSLTDALEKYKLNDAALVFQKDSSAALGMGFRCGFLGLLHLEIVQERLRRLVLERLHEAEVLGIRPEPVHEIRSVGCRFLTLIEHANTVDVEQNRATRCEHRPKLVQHHGALLRAQCAEIAPNHHHEVESTIGREVQIVRFDVFDVGAFALRGLAGVSDRVG